MITRSRSASLSAILIIGTILAGLAIRFASLGLPDAVSKYGGSALWAMMVYWIVSSARPHWSPGRSVLVSGVIAGSVELFKLYHTPALDAFRVTVPGKLLLGRIFSAWDLVAYGAAIVGAAVIDRAVRGRIARSSR